MALCALVEACAAQCDALIDRAVISDDGGFANDDAKTVINEDASANLGARMDFDPGKQAPKVRDKAPKPEQFGLPESVRQAVRHQRVQSGIASDDLKTIPSCWVSGNNGVDLVEKGIRHVLILTGCAYFLRSICLAIPRKRSISSL